MNFQSRHKANPVVILLCGLFAGDVSDDFARLFVVLLCIYPFHVRILKIVYKNDKNKSIFTGTVTFFYKASYNVDNLVVYMKTTTILSSIFICCTTVIFAQTKPISYTVNQYSDYKGKGVIDTINNPVLFVQQNLIGPCVQVTNIQVNYGNKENQKTLTPIGSWNDPFNNIGIDTGIVISTGNVFDIMNDFSSNTSGIIGSPGDSLLDSLCSCTTYDAVSIDFDFIPLADSVIPFEFVFGSEEYNEYVDGYFNDVFGFFISGPGYNGIENVALLPGTQLPISILNINNGYAPPGSPSAGPCINCTYYVDNTYGTFWGFDGYTIVVSFGIPVIALGQYHFKAVIADGLDRYYDSGVVLKAGSFAGSIITPAPSFTYTVTGNSVSFTNTTTSGMSYVWDFGDVTTSTDVNPVHNYSSAGTYTLRMTASNHCYTEEIEVAIDLTATNAGMAGDQPLSVSALNNNGRYAINGLNCNETPVFFSLDGRRICPAYQQSGNIMVIDLEAFEKGIYVIKLNDRTYKLVRY